MYGLDFKVASLEEIDGRWFFTLRYDDGVTQRYRTNKNGEGIYSVREDGTDGSQFLGNSQFCLNGVSRATILRRIRRVFES